MFQFGFFLRCCAPFETGQTKSFECNWQERKKVCLKCQQLIVKNAWDIGLFVLRKSHENVKKMLCKLSCSHVSRCFYICAVHIVFFGWAGQTHRAKYTLNSSVANILKSVIGGRPICSRSAHLNAMFNKMRRIIAWYALWERDNQFSMNMAIVCVHLTNWWSTLRELNRYAVIESIVCQLLNANA